MRVRKQSETCLSSIPRLLLDQDSFPISLHAAVLPHPIPRTGSARSLCHLFHPGHTSSTTPLICPNCHLFLKLLPLCVWALLPGHQPMEEAFPRTQDMFLLMEPRADIAFPNPNLSFIRLHRPTFSRTALWPHSTWMSLALFPG